MIDLICMFEHNFVIVSIKLLLIALHIIELFYF
jgi:hypothetical protein